jgi:TolA-binding protein
MASRILHRLAPALGLVTTACFATRSDVRVLQGDILTLRREAAMADTARTRQAEQLNARLTSTLATVNDSLRALGARVVASNGDNRSDFRQVREMIIQLQELVGASQAMISRFQADNERRIMEARQAQMVAPTVAPGDTTGVVSRPPATPVETVGPAQLYTEGLAQATRGNYSAAQAAFEDILARYPTAEVVPDAMVFLADVYDADGKPAQADSMYLRMVREHPRAARASTALYKSGNSLAKRGRRAEARVMMERVSKEYPVSEAADFAREWLMRNR